MGWKFIIPPPNTGLNDRFFIADPENHPGNTQGVMLLKQEGVDLSDECCCSGGTCCCERFATAPDQIFATVNSSGACDCLDQTSLEMDEFVSWGDCDGPGIDYIETVALLCGQANIAYEFKCDGSAAPGTYNFLIDGSTSGGIDIPMTLLSCNPLHAVGTYEASAAEMNALCGENVASTITVEITE